MISLPIRIQYSRNFHSSHKDKNAFTQKFHIDYLNICSRMREDSNTAVNGGLKTQLGSWTRHFRVRKIVLLRGASKKGIKGSHT